MTDEMDQPATKRDLHAVRDELKNEMATKHELHAVRDELKNEMATKHELHAVRDELKNEMATKHELSEGLGRLRRELHAVRDEVKREIAELRHEITERPTRSEMLALFEDQTHQLRAMLDPYRDLPQRTSRLERAVFGSGGPNDATSRAPRKRPAKKRKRAA